MLLKTAEDGSLNDGTVRRARGEKQSPHRRDGGDSTCRLREGWEEAELCSAHLYMLQGKPKHWATAYKHVLSASCMQKCPVNTTTGVQRKAERRVWLTCMCLLVSMHTQGHEWREDKAGAVD